MRTLRALVDTVDVSSQGGYFTRGFISALDQNGSC